MYFSLEGTGIPGPHMMRENKFPENPAYSAIAPLARLAEAPSQPVNESTANDPQPQLSVPKTA